MERDISADPRSGASGRTVSRSLWLAMCETVVGRRRKATEGLAMIAAAGLGAQAVPVRKTASRGAAPVDSHFPSPEIG